MVCFNASTVSEGLTETTAESLSSDGHLIATGMESVLDSEEVLAARDKLVERRLTELELRSASVVEDACSLR